MLTSKCFVPDFPSTSPNQPTRRLGKTIAATLLGGFLSITTALGEENARVKSIAVAVAVQAGSAINVTSSNGERWDAFVPGAITLDTFAGVDTRHPGYVDRAGLFLGTCGTDCRFNPRLGLWYVTRRDWRSEKQFDAPVSAIEASTFGQAILDACNTGLQSDGATRSHQQTLFLSATLSVNTRKKAGILGFHSNDANFVNTDPSLPFNGGDVAKSTLFQVKVNCIAFQMVKAPPQAKSIKIQVKQLGETCAKPTDVTAIITYDEATLSRFRFKHNGTLSKQYSDMARPVSGGRFQVKRTKRYYLDPGRHHLRIELHDGMKSRVETITVDCPPFKVTSTWLSYKVEKKATCKKRVRETAKFKATRPGKAAFQIKTQNGLVVHSGVLNFKRKGRGYVAVSKRHNLQMGAFASDMMALITDQPDANSGWVWLEVTCLKVLSGTLDLRAFAKKTCKGEAAISIRTNQAGKVPYRVDCTGGRSWVRKMTSHKTGPATYLGVAVLPFSVKNNEQINCALKTKSPFPIKILAVRGRKYQCHKRSVESPVSSLSAGDRRPAPKTLIGSSSSSQSCTRAHRVVCKRTPKRTCRSIKRRECKTVRARKCTHKKVRKCRQVTQRKCRRVRGRRICRSTRKPICRTVIKRDCRPITKRICKTKTQKICGTKMVRTCKRLVKVSCAK